VAAAPRRDEIASVKTVVRRIGRAGGVSALRSGSGYSQLGGDAIDPAQNKIVDPSGAKRLDDPVNAIDEADALATSIEANNRWTTDSPRARLDVGDRQPTTGSGVSRLLVVRTVGGAWNPRYVAPRADTWKRRSGRQKGDDRGIVAFGPFALPVWSEVATPIRAFVPVDPQPMPDRQGGPPRRRPRPGPGPDPRFASRMHHPADAPPATPRAPCARCPGEVGRVGLGA
jgi:hypothetical protein